MNSSSDPLNDPPKKPERVSLEATQRFLDELREKGIDIDDLPLEVRLKYGLFEDIPIDDVD